jgi:PAS domain S-box-containing protein
LRTRLALVVPFAVPLAAAALPLLPLVLLLGRATSSAAAAPVRATGVVLYSDPAWRRLYLHDGQQVSSVAAESLASFPAAGRRVAFEGGVVTDEGAAEWPTAEAFRPDAPGLRWASVEGVVRTEPRAPESRTGLRVAAGESALDVHVPAPPAPGASLVGARVRMRGVVEPARDAWSRPRVWLADWDAIEVLAPAPSWDAIPLGTIAAARALAASDAAGEVRLRGRARSRLSAHAFVVEDATATVTAELDRPEAVRQGTNIEVRGFVGRRRGEPVLLDARWRTIGTPEFQLSRREPGLARLERVADVRALSRAEAERGYPVRLRAVTTRYSGEEGQLFVQDATGALFVQLSTPIAGLAAGDDVLLEGFTAPGGLAPMVLHPAVRRLGPGRMPQTTPVTPARLADGYDDCRYVETTGVVRRIVSSSDEVVVLLGREGHLLPVHVSREHAAAHPLGVDAMLRVRGVAGSQFSWRNTFDHTELFVGRAEDVLVEAPAPDPFALPLLPLRDLLRSQTNGRWIRLVRTRGTVLHQRDGEPVYLRAPGGTLVAEAASAQPLLPGDEVEVAGFPVPGQPLARLEHASFRRLARGAPPEPMAVAPGELATAALDAPLARFRARLLEHVPHESGATLVLQAGDDLVAARADGDFAPAPPEGGLLEVTGLLLPHDRGTHPAAELRLLLRSPADVRLVARPPWLTPRRAAWSLAGLAAAALAAFAWVVTLGRQVNARTAELRAAEQRYRLLADNATDVVLTTDKDLRLTYVSPSVTRDSGYTVEEALSVPLEGLLTPASWDKLRSTFSSASQAPPGTPLEIEVEIVRKDGAHRFMHVRATAMRDASGKVNGFTAAARDVTARRQAQVEGARLAAAIEQSADAIVLTDPEGAILYVNPAFERVTGYAAHEVLGANPSILKAGTHDRSFYQGLWTTLRSGSTWEGRFTNRRKDGSAFFEDASIAPVRDRTGTLAGYVAVKRDVTRQVQMESQLAQAQKMEAIGRLAAGIAHDFNNVLAIILSHADLAMKRAAADEKTAACVAAIREAALRGSGLTRQILTFSRQAKTATQTIDPRQVVSDAVRMLRVLVPPGVLVRERLESTALVAADATQLEQLVMNLGTNAGLAMKETGGSVEIALEDACVDAGFAERHPPLRSGQCLLLTVRDQGCGMSRETLARIFEPFFTTRPARDGTGMGLAVVHGIVHNHGGAITVSSEPGHGSTFCVYLPGVPGVSS